MTDAPNPLDYSPAPAGRGRRRVVRLVAFALVVLLAAWGALNRAELLRWMQQKQRMWAEVRRFDACATYTAPADLIAWEEDTSEIERLSDSSLHTVGYSRNVSKLTGRHAATIEPWPWRDLAVYGAAAPAMGVVFMHERTSTAGNP